MSREFSHPSILLTTVVLASTLVAAALFSSAKGNEAVASAELLPHVPGELLIKFRPEARQDDRLAVRAQLDADALHTFESGAQHWRLGPGITVEEALAALDGNEHVEYAEPNAIGTLHAPKVPDDPLYPLQWPLQSVDPNTLQAPDAWGKTTGSPSVVVAVIDNGVYRAHEDLEDNMWTNDPECAQNADPNFDDDGNGYKDDCNGWNFVLDIPETNPPNFTHGTSIAGIIGAEAGSTGNQRGIAGLNWQVKIMDLKSYNVSLIGTLSNATEAIEYAVNNGAHVINASWGFGCTNPPAACLQTLRDAVQLAANREVLVVASAGNVGESIDYPSQYAQYPASYQLSNVVAVAATDDNDARAFPPPPLGGSSNFGAISVDLGAPGLDILTTYYNPGDPNKYVDDFWGTSAAAPHVAGVAALIKSLNVNMPHELVRTRLLDLSSLDQVWDLRPTGPTPTVTGGRLNAFKTIDDPNDSVPPTAINNLAAPSGSSASVTLTWNATGDDGTTGAAALHKIRYSTAPITESNWLLATPVGGEPVPGSPGTPHTKEVFGLTHSTTYYFRLRAYDEWGNGPLSNEVSRTTCPLCLATSYCKYLEFRCEYTGCAPVGCCTYDYCHEDSTCTVSEPCPTGACPASCQ